MACLGKDEAACDCTGFSDKASGNTHIDQIRNVSTVAAAAVEPDTNHIRCLECMLFLSVTVFLDVL